MRNRIEVAGQVRVDHLMMPPAHQPLHLPHRLLRVALRSVGILLRWQVRLEYRIEHQHRRRLHHPVSYRRNPQRTLLPIPLRYPHPPHRRGTVGLPPQLPRQLPKPLLHTPRLDALERLAVHTRRPARSAAAFEGVGQHVRPIHLVVELIEATLGFRLRFRMQRLPQLLDTGRCSQAHRQSPLARSFRRSFQTKGPSLPRHYPRSPVLRPSPPPRPADSAPHDAAVGPYRFRPPTGASRVAHPPLYMHAVATTPAEPRGCSCRSLPLVAAAFSLSWRDRLPHSLFSGPARRSLRVTACMLAESLRTLFSECFSCFAVKVLGLGTNKSPQPEDASQWLMARGGVSAARWLFGLPRFVARWRPRPERVVFQTVAAVACRHRRTATQWRAIFSSSGVDGHAPTMSVCCLHNRSKCYRLERHLPGGNYTR